MLLTDLDEVLDLRDIDPDQLIVVCTRGRSVYRLRVMANLNVRVENDAAGFSPGEMIRIDGNRLTVGRSMHVHAADGKSWPTSTIQSIEVEE